MSSWTATDVRQEGPSSWRLLRDVAFHVGGLPSPLGCVVTVPAGYVCDLASAPRVLRGLVDRDALAPAALLHDWLLGLGTSRVIADACFYERRARRASRGGPRASPTPASGCGPPAGPAERRLLC